MEKRVLDTNKIIVGGKIVGKYDNGKMLEFTILTFANNQRDFPEVVCFGVNREKFLHFEKGMYVVAECTMQTRKVVQRGKTSYPENIIVYDMSELDKTMDKLYGLSGSRYDFKNKVLMAGEVVNIFKAEKVTILTIKNTADGKLSFPKLSIFGKARNYISKNVAIGDKICSVGFVQTNRKEIDGKARFFQTLTVSDITKTPANS